MKTTAAVILAAGIGSRLRPITNDRPKALLDLGAETILGRAVRLLAEYGVRKIVLATGYREDAVQAAMALHAGQLTIEYCKNTEYYRTQNSVSLNLCRDSIGSDAFFKLDGDVVFLRQVLERLDSSSAELAVAVDSGRTLDAEAMKVSALGQRITAFGKDIELRASAGESIGIERISSGASAMLFNALARTISGGETGLYYEDIYSQLIERGELSAEVIPVSDLPWTEVDDFADLERARALVRELRAGA